MAFYSLLVILFSFFCFSCSNQTNQTHGPCELTNPTWVKSVDKHLLLQSYLGSSRANVIVAKDGSGNFRNVKAAIDSIPKSNNKRYVIYIKGGVYDERVEVKSTNVMLVGDGIGKTIITGNRSVGGGFQTHDTTTFVATGNGFIAKGITFRNTAGAASHQAVAMLFTSDRSVFYKCDFEGYQYTLCLQAGKQFYKECDIYGTVDFIFGNDAAAVLQNCTIYARNAINTSTIVITAQGRTNPEASSGIIIHNSKVIGAPGFNPSSVKAYLGRPWKNYSRTVFMKTSLDSFINPAGWMEWEGSPKFDDTLFYAEYANSGPGSNTVHRVNWKGYHVFTHESQAKPFTVKNFIDGNSWIHNTGVPFDSGL